MQADLELHAKPCISVEGSFFLALGPREEEEGGVWEGAAEGLEQRDPKFCLPL